MQGNTILKLYLCQVIVKFALQKYCLQNLVSFQIKTEYVFC